MKILIKIIFIQLLMITPLYSQKEVALTKINARYYNPLFEKVSEFTLQINGVQRKGDTFAFMYFAPTRVKYAAILSQEKREELLTALQKYKKWRKIAIDNKVEHIKNIATFPITGSINFNTDTIAYDPNVTIRFASNSIEDHFLVFIFHKTDTNNEFIKMRPNGFFLDYDNVLALEKLLQENNFVTKTEIGLERKRKKDALFQ